MKGRQSCIFSYMKSVCLLAKFVLLKGFKYLQKLEPSWKFSGYRPVMLYQVGTRGQYSINDFSIRFGYLPSIDLMHWRHVSITTTPCWGLVLIVLRTRAVLEERWLSVGARPRAGPAVWHARWLHAWRWRTWQCLVWPPTRGGALLWRHMHKVYS